MENFVGYPLEVVLNKLEQEKIKYKIVENNFKIEGDKLLITNVKSQDNTLVLTVGKFIFDIEGKQDEKNFKS